LISWEQAASRWEGSLRPFKGLLHLSSVLGQEKTALKAQTILRELEFHEQLESLQAGRSSIVQKNAELIQKNDLLDQEAAELDRKIRGMATSFSWKMTAPLRYLEREFVSWFTTPICDKSGR
jgi:hypothetical protein